MPRRIPAVSRHERTCHPTHFDAMTHQYSMLRPGLAAILLISVLSGCSLPAGRAVDRQTRAFIAYWPPPDGHSGLRLAVKDLIDMKGVVTTAGSEHFARYGRPAERDAACMSLARERKVHIVGKTNLTEFALGTSGVNAYFGTPRNPLTDDSRLIPGGSSSGSAVAVASGMADVAFGTDTAGSIRTPAACCGIVGLKTTFGLVPLDGVFPLSPGNLDSVGPMARDISHLVQGMDLLNRGFAARYRSAVAATPSARGITVGRLFIDGTDAAIDRAIDQALERTGFRVVRLDAAFADEWRKAGRHGDVVALADSWVTHEKSRSLPGVTAGTKAAILLGEAAYRIDYRHAMESRAAWRRTLRNVFAKVDFIALPTLKRTPPKFPLFGRSPIDARVLGMQNTAAVSYAGNPALALPVPIEGSHVPVTSLQLVGPPLSEARLVNAGRLVEKAVKGRQ
jgi:Asp-tRNA(Asn)/Glu-tRNA(Gln) amidotransferase A subunit family amidase